MELTDIDTGEVLTFRLLQVLVILLLPQTQRQHHSSNPAADWYGESEVVVVVSDGELTDTTSFYANSKSSK